MDKNEINKMLGEFCGHKIKEFKPGNSLLYWSDRFASWMDWNPYDDIRQAFEVVDKMRQDDYWLSLVFKTSRDDIYQIEKPAHWQARFRCVRGATRPDGISESETRTTAICEAAAQAIGKEGE